MSERTLAMVPGPVELEPLRDVCLSATAQPFFSVAGSGTVAMQPAVANVIERGEAPEGRSVKKVLASGRWGCLSFRCAKREWRRRRRRGGPPTEVWAAGAVLTVNRP